eukprot:982417-Rhodomonas_salina.1
MYNRSGKGMGGPAGRTQEADMMERQNEALVGNLQNKINNLKSITIAIGDEVREQNKFLDGMQNGMAANDNLLGSTMQKMGVSSSTVHMQLHAILLCSKSSLRMRRRAGATPLTLTAELTTRVRSKCTTATDPCPSSTSPSSVFSAS